MPHILSNDNDGITRATTYDPELGLTIEDWTPQGLQEITLSPGAVMALLRQLPTALLQDALDEAVCHWSVSPGLAVCGSDLCTQRLTPAPQYTTCPACLTAWHALCRAEPGDYLELREAFAGRPGLGTLRCDKSLTLDCDDDNTRRIR